MDTDVAKAAGGGGGLGHTSMLSENVWKYTVKLGEFRHLIVFFFEITLLRLV